ncbi:MAG: preprotein translocase subunit SecG [Xanthomonadales bacterium]|jgi:preprotein translocase subunit SecG|nr:preprotein translocase subunit SecG [Xanthomonadales bacterium]
MQVLNIFHVLIAIALIAFVLIQKGQGATAGAAFGSGASGTVFGARGAGNFLSRTTWILAGLFCAISLTMAIMVSRMMDNPEVGLGVVSTDQAASVVSEVQPAVEGADGEAMTGAEDISASDLPSVQPVAEDMPALDTSAVEGAGAEDLPAVDTENEGPDEKTGNG